MSTDLIERLRAMYALRGKSTPLSDVIGVCNEAADELTRLRAEVDALRSALELIASCESRFKGDVVDLAQEALAKEPTP